MANNTTAPPLDYALIESAVSKGNKNDLRVLFQNISQSLSNLQQATGTPSATSKSNISAPPQGSIAATGANGVFSLAIAPAPTNPPAAQWHEVSYSPVKGFTSNVTVMEPTTATQVSLNLPGATNFFRLRSSFNKTVYNQPVLHGQEAVSSNLLSSAATESAPAFNQTNFGTVNSAAVGTTAIVTVAGAGTSLGSVPTIKGAAQSLTPSATLIGAEPGSTQYVGYDQNAQEYVMDTTLPSVFGDTVTPIGKVSVVGTGTPTLPTIVPVNSFGYIIGYDVTNGGSGASQPYTLTFGSVGGGAGAVPGAQTIEGGVLISIAPGNPGNGAYAGGTTLTASGGSGGGAPGGGTAEGNTNGRLTI
jgi:hypothetical protein